MEGTTPTEWQAQLDAVESQARLGASDRWSGLIERAVDETAQRIANRETKGRQIDDLAEKLALYPQQLTSLFTERQLKSLQTDRIDTLTRARRISAILRSRLPERVRSIAKERAQYRAGRN